MKIIRLSEVKDKILEKLNKKKQSQGRVFEESIKDSMKMESNKDPKK